MISLLWEQHSLLVIIVLFFNLLTVLSNQRTLRKFHQFAPPARWPRVSVLVPARDEAANIRPCLESLLNQDYPNYEVIMLDDHSGDQTWEIAQDVAARFPHLRLLKGKPLPGGWLGKHWACHQLGEEASGELLLFTDADTRHAPTTLRHSVAALLNEDADLVTAFPREEVKTWGEKLIVPIMAWGIMAFLPLRLAYRFALPGLSVSIGQFMLFRRQAYERIGGFAAVRAERVDDVALGRRIIRHGLRWRLMDGGDHVRCRMYRGFWEAVDGFSKNIFAFFNYHLALYLLGWGWVSLMFIEPALSLGAYYLTGETLPHAPFPQAAIAVLLSLLIWYLAYQRFQFPLYLIWLYPLSMTLFVLIAMRSMVQTLTGRAEWKGRDLARPVIRWL
ncbi:MAG: glycosyltransferase [Anaerolineae bacterium]|nr:MAG: glycosyltransferase [Anaerolineae bacterium]